MKPRILYIEHKTDQSDRGEAWISQVEFSKSSQTVYFNNKAFKKIRKGGVSGNHYDLETGDEYWISGIKKSGQDRHWAGGGRIGIDRRIVDQYLELVDFEVLDEANFELVDILETDKSRFNQIENEKF